MPKRLEKYLLFLEFYDIGVEIIACQVLRDNKHVKTFKVLNSILYLGNEAFRGSDLTTLIVGENLIKHGGSPFLYTGGADNVYISKNVLTVLEDSVTALISNTGNCNIYFDGSLEEATQLMEKIIAESSSYNNKITLADYNTQSERGNIKNIIIFYNYNIRHKLFKYSLTGIEPNCLGTINPRAFVRPLS